MSNDSGSGLTAWQGPFIIHSTPNGVVRWDLRDRNSVSRQKLGRNEGTSRDKRVHLGLARKYAFPRAEPSLGSRSEMADPFTNLGRAKHGVFLILPIHLRTIRDRAETCSVLESVSACLGLSTMGCLMRSRWHYSVGQHRSSRRASQPMRAFEWFVVGSASYLGRFISIL